MGILAFASAKKQYDIPQTIDVLPEFTLDEYSGVYRVCLGKVDATEVEKDLYFAAFKELRRRMKKGYIQGLLLKQDNFVLQSDISTAIITVTRYGVFCDIEMELSTTELKEDI